MRKLVSTLAALLVLIGTAPATITSAHAAPRGNAFCKLDGTPTPTRLAALVRQSLGKDPSGNTPLDPSACHEARPATPNEFYTTLSMSDPDSGMTNAHQLPKYLESLVKVAVREKYYSACLAFGIKGWYPLVNCVARNLHPHEFAWGNPRTHKPVLQGDCSNPMQQPEQQSGCGDVLVWVNKGDTVLLSGHGPTDITKKRCTGLLRPGESDFESPAVERCLHPYCSLGEADAYAEYPEQWTGSFLAEQSGWTVLRVPLEVVQAHSGHQIFFCVHRPGSPDLWALGVRWFDYLPEGSPYVPAKDRYVAVIQPDYAAALAAGRQTRVEGFQSVLWWDHDASHFRQDNANVVVPDP